MTPWLGSAFFDECHRQISMLPWQQWSTADGRDWSLFKRKKELNGD